MFSNRWIYFALFFLASIAASLVLTKLTRFTASHLGIHDLPDNPRKIHHEPKPKLGGIAVFTTFVVMLVLLALSGGTDEISPVRLVGIVLGGVILVIGGALDDKYDLPAGKQIIFPIAASLAAVLFGTHISYITSPLGGPIVLDQYKIAGYPVLGSALVFFWILGMIYTTKFLDGMDGLVSGISAIAGLVIFVLSLAPAVNQTTTAFLALIFSGVCLGFLPFNFYPAKIFLGEGGSTFTGFMIGALAVISGGKIATTMLVLGIPVLDMVWVIFRRLWFGASPFGGDKKHLHFRLLDIGLSQRQAVVFLYLISAVFGGIAVFLQSRGKLIALGVLALVMLIVALGVVAIYRKKIKNQEL